MDTKQLFHSGVKKIILTFLVQGIVLLLSLVTGFLLPRMMGKADFGYWQIYIVYSSYLHLFGLGFNDGISLYYGGYDYKDLPFGRIRSAMRNMGVYLCGLVALLLLAAGFMGNVEYRFICRMLVLNIPLTFLQCVLMSLFISVNDTWFYNLVNFLLKVVTTGFYLVLLFMVGTYSFEKMIIMDIMARVLVIFICMIIGRDFLFGKKDNFSQGMEEIKEKTSSGMRITLATVAATLIPISGRMVIQVNESIEVFGEYSFAMSLLQIVLVFASAAGAVLFPLLRKAKEDERANIYRKLSFAMQGLMYIALFVYIPIYYIIKWYLHDYVAVLEYVNFVILMCIPLGKMQVVMMPYYKMERLEKEYLVISILGNVGILLTTGVCYYIFGSVFGVAIAMSITGILWGRCTERYLLYKMGEKQDRKSDLSEAFVVIGFILGTYGKNIALFIILYTIILCIYFLYHRNSVVGVIKRRGRMQ